MHKFIRTTLLLTALTAGAVPAMAQDHALPVQDFIEDIEACVVVVAEGIPVPEGVEIEETVHITVDEDGNVTLQSEDIDAPGLYFEGELEDTVEEDFNVVIDEDGNVTIEGDVLEGFDPNAPELFFQGEIGTLEAFGAEGCELVEIDSLPDVEFEWFSFRFDSDE